MTSHRIDIDRPEVVAIGTIPPPVTGMTLLTQQVIGGLREAGDLTFFNWSTGIATRGLKFRFARVLRFFKSLIWLAGRGRMRNARLYAVANSKSGLYLTIALVWLARRLGYKIYLHHHTYYYIEQFDRRMAWIDRIVEPDGVHVVHTSQMAEDFNEVYSTRCSFAFVYPSVVTTPIVGARDRTRSPFRIGHLSNLSVAKGLDYVLATMRELRSSGMQVRLTLAGPYHTREARRLVEQALADFGDIIDYVGPVFGDEKTSFFNSIDCFLFPSRSESWGIVLHEAMTSGLPVITYDRGCTKTVVGDQGGLVIDPCADFPALAVAQIGRWIDEPNEYCLASQAAVEQAARLQRQGQSTLDEFVEHMFGGARSALHLPAHSVNPTHQCEGA